jgi:predicted RNA binding protein YcfA (HicA-like mRNA interferase family)
VDGESLAKHLERRWGYARAGQTGSHIKLRTEEPTGHTATIPAHRPLKTGTLHGILKSVAAHKQKSIADVVEGL